MEWSNDAVIEFLKLVQAEPSIWNPKNQHNKNRNYVNKAWVRVKDSFSLPFNVEQLKRKRNSLLTQYRYILRKMKGATNTDSEEDENFKPKWFAFDVIHSYLGTLYENQPMIKSEEGLETSIERPISHESDYLIESNTDIMESRESNNQSESPCGSDNNYEIPKKRRRIQDIQVDKNQMNDPFSNKNSNRKTNEINECDLYGQLLAEKLKPLQTDHRMILMNDIDNLVFKYIMRVRKGISSTEINNDQLSQPASHQDPLNLKN